MRNILESITEKFFKLSALLSIGITLLIFIFMLILSLPLIKEGILSFFIMGWNPAKGNYGIGPMIVGSLIISTLAIFFAFPLSISCAAFMTIIKYTRITNIIKKIVLISVGIPPVIYGFIAIFTLVPFIRNLFNKGSGMSILSTSLVLALLISPTMILIFVDTFKSVKKSYILALDSLGCSPVQKLLYIIIPCAKDGIIAGLLLGMGRAIGDTLIALMLSGNAAHVPSSLLDSVRSLTAHIALVKSADVDSLQFKSIFLSGLVLYTFVTLIVCIVNIRLRKSISVNNVYE